MKFIRMQKLFNFELNKGLTIEKNKLKYNHLASNLLNIIQKRMCSYISILNSNSLSSFYQRTTSHEMKMLKKSKDAILIHNILFNLTKNKFNEFKYQSALHQISKKVTRDDYIENTNIINDNNKITAIKMLISKFV